TNIRRALLGEIPLEGEGEPFEPKIEEKFIELSGVAGELQQYYLRTALRPGKMFSLGPSLMVPATLISEKVSGPSGSKGCCTHLYLIVLGLSGSGKEHVIGTSKEALIKCDQGKFMGRNRFKSGTAVINLIRERKVVLCSMDEYGKMLAKISNDRALDCEKEIADRLKEIWGVEPGVPYATPIGAHEDFEIIDGVRLSILGVGIPDDFFIACKSKEMVDGTLNRHLIVEEKVRPPRQPNPSTEEFPKSIIDGLKKLASIEKTRLDWDKGAKEIFEAEVERIEALTNETEMN